MLTVVDIRDTLSFSPYSSPSSVAKRVRILVTANRNAPRSIATTPIATIQQLVLS